MLLYAFTCILAGCNQTSLNKGKNVDPRATITSHQDGDQVFSDQAIEFRATVADDDHAINQLEVEWRIDEVVVCPFSPVSDELGETTCTATMSEGESTVKVTARDPKSGVGVSSIQLSVIASAPPTAELLAPADGDVVALGDSISFQGVVSDAEDDASELSVELRSDISGDLGLAISPDSNGEFSVSTSLDAGNHAITLEAKDSSGKTATDTVNIVVNTRPSCAITTPTSGDSGDFGAQVVFTGTATDPDIYADQLAVEWTSSIDGSLGSTTPDSNGNVSFAYTDLSSATHTISMVVSDNHSAQCTSTIIYSVGSPPTIQITEPVSGSLLNEGDFITFSALVTDNEDQGSALSIEWSSSLDGVLSTQSADSQGNAQYATSTLSNGEHAITATVTDSDGLYAVDTVYLLVNALPTQPSVSISPSTPTTSQPLTATASGATDNDGDAISYTYEWFKNATPTSNTGSLLPAANTAKGDIWTVRATPNDGLSDGPWAEASVTIENSDPVLSSVTITPSMPATMDDLTCSYAASDDDGDSLTASYTWARNGTSQASTTNTLQAPFQQGDVLSCTVVASDGQAQTSSMTAQVTVSNSSPAISNLSIGPSIVYTNDSLSATVTATDPDGDSLSYQWDWYVDDGNGAQLVQSLASSNTTSSLDGQQHFDRDDVVYVQVGVTDGSTTMTQNSSSITIANTPPSASGVVISPAAPVVGQDDLVCTASGSDVDQDGVTLTYTWLANGGATAYSSDTVPANALSQGEVWTCVATPNDGTDDGTPATASVTIEADLGDATGLSTCSSAGTVSDASGNQIQFCLSEPGALSGNVATDAASNTWQPGSHYVFIPE